MNRIKLETGAVRVPFSTGMTGEEADGRALKKASDRIRRITGAVPENLRVARKSIDARRGEISFVYTVYGEIEADGGIKEHNLKRLTDRGLSVAVMGTALYRCDSPAEMMKRLHAMGERNA